MKLFNIVTESDLTDPNKGRYVYHVSSKLFKDIRALEYQTGKKKKDYSLITDIDNYFKEVNSFPGVITKKDVDLLRRNGFVNWGTGKLYVYKIDLIKNKHNINHINVTSTPEQRQYDSENWDEFYSKYSSLSDEEWIKGKDAYLSKRDLHLANLGIRRDLTLEEYLSLIVTKDWDDSSKYFKINSKHGNKKQYASYIPHVQINTKGPLSFESVETLY